MSASTQPVSAPAYRGLVDLARRANELGKLYDEEREAFGQLCDVVAVAIEMIEDAETALHVHIIEQTVIAGVRPRDQRREPFASMRRAADDRVAEIEEAGTDAGAGT